MEDKLRSVYQFLEENNLHETIDLLRRELGVAKHVTPNTAAPYDHSKSELTSEQHVDEEREAQLRTTRRPEPARHKRAVAPAQELRHRDAGAQRLVQQAEGPAYAGRYDGLAEPLVRRLGGREDF